MPFITVSFYDDEHKQKLSNTPKYIAIEELIKKGFTCSDADLWTYSLFKEQKPFPGFRNFQDLQNLLPKRWQKIKDYFLLKNHTIRAILPSAQNQELTEELGVGAALALISHIHGLTQADWNIISITKSKDLDFSINPNSTKIIDNLRKANITQITESSQEEIIKTPVISKVASDGERFIEVEAKCSYVEKDGKKTISTMKADIKNKKEVQRRDHNNQNLLYGVITTYSANKGVIAHSRILDPPAVYNPNDQPRKVKLLSRLNFYLDQLNLFSRANYLIALANRVRDISVLENYESLDAQPLLNRKGQKFEIPSSYFVSRTVLNIGEGIGIGEVFPLSSIQYFFFGLDIAIVSKLIDQNFSQILEYRCNLPSLFNLEVPAKVKIQNLELYPIDSTNFDRAGDRSRVLMTLFGDLYINSAGIIIGNLS